MCWTCFTVHQFFCSFARVGLASYTIVPQHAHVGISTDSQVAHDASCAVVEDQRRLMHATACFFEIRVFILGLCGCMCTCMVYSSHMVLLVLDLQMIATYKEHSHDRSIGPPMKCSKCACACRGQRSAREIMANIRTKVLAPCIWNAGAFHDHRASVASTKRGTGVARPNCLQCNAH
jgi:hypothetical protein